VYGVDASDVMVRAATKRNRQAVRDGRVRLMHSSVEQLPAFPPLDAILAVNSVGFWPDPPLRVKELRALLRPGGRIALASQPRNPGADETDTQRAAQEIEALLTDAGFGELRASTLQLDPPVVCVIGVA
jgi:SAM-dependent methyltransferase